MKQCIPLLLITYLVVLSACNSTRIVKPLEKKEVAVGLDFGGPIIDFSGTKIPVPFSSVTVGYGVDSNLTVFGAAHITSAIFGTIQWDLGVVGEVLRPQKGYLPGLSIGASSQMFVDVFKANFRLYPVLDVNLYWNYIPKHKHYFYLNWGSWFDFWQRAQGRVNTQLYYPSFSLGHTFENKKMRYTIEGKYIAPGISNMGTPLKFNGVDGYGSWGVYISVYRKF
ncbi:MULTISPECIES: hypothetical protein [unclassified Aureispira]|uniref:hypothetical protein n=1 Tax=unclassified Aureispira TaxID=2649989 RepID=UPI000696CFAB|nr:MULTISPECIES: hypothetical protein [unclassified Aureispira]WMX17423.1 hypothetical protein QP953_13660 [Aureispira sp. CCB-E]